MYGRVCFNPKRYEVTGNVEKWTYNDYSQPVYVSTIQTNVKAAYPTTVNGFADGVYYLVEKSYAW